MLVGFIISILFATRAGLYLLDIMDNFINNYGVVVVGLLETILVGWIVKPETIRDHTNSVSYYRIGKWWDIIIKCINPIVLTFILVQSFITEMRTPYGGYDLQALFVYGWGAILIGITGSILISKQPWRDNINLKMNKGVVIKMTLSATIFLV